MHIALHTLRRQIRSILIEGRVEDLQKKYPKLNVAEINDHDPSANSKYLPWMLKQLSSGASENDLYPTVALFHKHVNKLKKHDINQYATLKELEDEIKEFPKMSASQQKKVVKAEGAQKVFAEGPITVVRVDTKDACMAYGANTKWCITMKNAPYYTQYTSKNVVFYFVLNSALDANDPKAKVAIAVGRDLKNDVVGVEFYDAQDKSLSEDEFMKLTPTSKKILSVARDDASKQPKGLVAKIKSNEATDEEYAIGAESDDESIRVLVANNKSTPSNLLVKLSSDENVDVRINVAKNVNTPQDVLTKLSSDDDNHVRKAVAENVKTPVEVLSKLSSDIDKNVRARVAHNVNIPPEALVKLSSDKKILVRINVIENENTPFKVLDDLSSDKEVSIRMSVAKNVGANSLKILDKLSYDEHASVRAIIASNLATPKSVLDRLSDDADAIVRTNVAINQNTSPETLDKLSNDKNDTVRLQVASNQNAKNDSLLRLSHDKDDFVSACARHLLKARTT
jgi:hypothetical protein